MAFDRKGSNFFLLLFNVHAHNVLFVYYYGGTNDDWFLLFRLWAEGGGWAAGNVAEVEDEDEIREDFWLQRHSLFFLSSLILDSLIFSSMAYVDRNPQTRRTDERDEALRGCLYQHVTVLTEKLFMIYRDFWLLCWGLS